MNTRVVTAEDAALFRAGLARLIEDRGHRVCAAVGDGGALLAAVAKHQPDVVVADIRMPPTHADEGLRAALEIRRQHSRTGVLVLSQYIETRYTARLPTPRSSASYCAPAAAPTAWPRSPPVSAAFSR